MGKPAYAFNNEAVWLREYLRAYGHDLRFDRDALEQMARSGAGGLAVRTAIGNCEVVDCEPDPAGSIWTAKGEDTDGRELWTRLRVRAPEHRVEVIGVSVSERGRR